MRRITYYCAFYHYIGKKVKCQEKFLKNAKKISVCFGCRPASADMTNPLTEDRSHYTKADLRE